MIDYPENSNRDLPPFVQVFEFDDIINEFTKTEPKSSLQKQYFYIVELWWYLTNIVPMRPNEFLRIRKYCLDQRNDGTYWLEIPRSKSLSESLEKEIWYQWIEINIEVFDVIVQYLETLNQHVPDSYYLFPVEIHEKFLKGKGVGKKYVENKFLSTSQLNKWIDRFYQEIVKDRYHVDVQKKNKRWRHTPFCYYKYVPTRLQYVIHI
jgi:hypothetical protein